MYQNYRSPTFVLELKSSTLHTGTLPVVINSGHYGATNLTTSVRYQVLILFFLYIPFQVDCEQVSYSAVHGSLEHAPNYVLHIYPPAILHNYLPYSIHYASPVSRQ